MKTVPLPFPLGLGPQFCIVHNKYPQWEIYFKLYLFSPISEEITIIKI